MSDSERVGGNRNLSRRGFPFPKLTPRGATGAVPSGQGAVRLQEGEVGSAKLAPGCGSGGDVDVDIVPMKSNSGWELV